VKKYGEGGQATDDIIIRPIRFACWITKAKYTHSEYVIRIALPGRHWFHERAPLLTLVRTLLVLALEAWEVL